MGNPDKGISPVWAGFISGITLVAIFIVITRYIDYNKDFNNMFIVFGIIAIIAYIFSVIINILSQYFECDKVEFKQVFLGGLPSIGTIFLSFLIPYFKVCRIPIISLFSSFSNQNNNQNKNTCCSALSMDEIERNNPMLHTIAYSFYILWGMIYGTVIGKSMSTIC